MSRSIDPRPSESQSEGVVQRPAARVRPYAELYEGLSSTAHFFRMRLQRVRELLGNCPVGTVLDVGCGPALMFQHLLERGFECFGVDLSPHMVDECLRRFGQEPHAHFGVGSIEGLMFFDAFFDVVLCLGVLEYVDVPTAVREMARVLKPHGTLVVSMLNWISPYRLWEQAVYQPAARLVQGLSRRPAPASTPVHPCSERTLKRVLTEQRLEIVDTVYFDFNLFLPPLDGRHPRMTEGVTQRLEPLARGPLRRLGTGFLVKAVKD